MLAVEWIQLTLLQHYSCCVFEASPVLLFSMHERSPRHQHLWCYFYILFQSIILASVCRPAGAFESTRSRSRGGKASQEWSTTIISLTSNTRILHTCWPQHSCTTADDKRTLWCLISNNSLPLQLTINVLASEQWHYTVFRYCFSISTSFSSA